MSLLLQNHLPKRGARPLQGKRRQTGGEQIKKGIVLVARWFRVIRKDAVLITE